MNRGRNSHSVRHFLVGISVVCLACTPDFKSHEVDSPVKLLREVEQEPLLIPTESELSLKGLIEEAVLNNSGLRAIHAQVRELVQKSIVEGELPDPVFSYSYFVRETETRVGPQNQSIGLSQPIPWFGKRETKAKIETIKAQALTELWRSRRNALAYEIQKVYHSLSYIEEAIDITQAALDLVGGWEHVLTQMIRTQGHSQSDLIKVQVELGQLEDRLASLREQKSPLIASLNALRNIEINTPLELEDLKSAFSSEPKSFSDDQIAFFRKLIPVHHPDVKRLQYLKKAADEGINFADLSFFPDLGVGITMIDVGSRLEALDEGGSDALLLSFSMTLPWNQKKYQAKKNQAVLAKERAGLILQEKKYQQEAKVNAVIFRLNDASRKIRLYRDSLIPKAQESLHSSYTAFEAGKRGFLDVIDAERSVLSFDMELAKSIAEYRSAFAELLSVVGVHEGTILTDLGV